MTCRLPRIPPNRERKTSISTRLSSFGEPRRIDELRREFPSPKYGVPEVAKTFFPMLEQRPLEEKFPHPRLLEKLKVLYYTRGKLGQKIMRERDKLTYTVEDEYNQKKVVRMSSYDPLHDPNLAHYLSRPLIKQHLACQGLLKDNDQVVCNLKNFNEFRKYLGVAQNDRLAELIRRKHTDDVRRQAEWAEMRSLGAWRTDVSQRHDDATARRKAHDAGVITKLKGSLRRNQERREQAEEKKANMRVDALELRQNDDNVRAMKYDRAQLPSIEKRRSTMLKILEKEKGTDVRLLSDRIAIQKYKKMRNLERVAGITNAQLAHKEIQKQVQETQKAELQTKAFQRSVRYQRKWENLPERVEKSRAEKRRIDALVRKYFYRWLSKVRQRHQRRDQEKKGGHNSHWDVHDELEKANTRFCEDRINIINAKTFIAAAKRQLEIEIEEEKRKSTFYDEEYAKMTETFRGDNSDGDDGDDITDSDESNYGTRNVRTVT